MFLLVGLCPVALLLAINILVDPYEVFQTKIFPEVGATQERYLKVEYLKKNRRFDTFLLGGSRMGTTVPTEIEQLLPGHHIYNFFVSSGNQYDNLIHVRWLLQTQPQIRNLYIQVDWPESYGLTREYLQYLTHPEVLGDNAPGFLRKYLFTFAPNAFEFKIENNTKRKGEFRLDLASGHFDYPKRNAVIAADCGEYVMQVKDFAAPAQETAQSEGQKQLNTRSLAALAELLAAAKSRGVDTTIFVTPHHHRFLDRINLAEYLKFLNDLAAITPYWNFAFYSSITSNDCNYYEPSHYIAKVAPLLYAAMSKKSASREYAHYVNAENVASELEFVRGNFQSHRKPALQ
jgi:hypothetical protein